MAEKQQQQGHNLLNSVLEASISTCLATPTLLSIIRTEIGEMIGFKNLCTVLFLKFEIKIRLKGRVKKEKQLVTVLSEKT